MNTESFQIDVLSGVANEACVFKGDNYRITILSSVLIRLEYNENGRFNDFPTFFALNRKFTEKPYFTVKEDEKYLNITNSVFVLEYAKGKPFVGSKFVPDTNLRVTLRDGEKVWYYKNPEVKNMKGNLNGFNDSAYTKGLFNLDGFSCIDDSKTPVFVQDGTYRKNPSDGIDLYLFIYGKNFQEALNSYFNLTGKPSLIPRYTLGVMWNKNEDYYQIDVTNIANNFKKHALPLSAILLGDKWNKGINGDLNSNYIFDPVKYSDKDKLKTYLNDNKIKFGITINTESGLLPNDNAYNVIKEISKSSSNNIPINIYNTKVLNTYINDIIDKLNVDFVCLENNISDRISGFIFTHYLYKYFEKKNYRSFIISRNYKMASHRYSLLYSGKTNVSWKTLKELPYYNNLSANMGLSWWTHDIGGYEKGIEESELYIRYVQLGVYNPIFRFSSNEGRFYKREPWKWDVKTESIVKYYLQTRYKLIPYLYSCAYDYSFNGKNVIKPLYYDYKEIIDEPLYRNEYYFGSELLVCPITEPKDSIMNRVVHRIYIPKGTWYDFKTGKKFPGDKRYVTFYKDEDYPVFAKSGSIIPLAILDNDNINDTNPPKKLEVHVFPGESNSFNLYEDDGITNNYLNNLYIVTNIDYNYRENNYTLIFRPIEGKTGIIPEYRDYKIVFRNTKRPSNVKVNVGPYEVDFITTSEENDFIIEIPNVKTDQQLTINCAGEAIEIDAVRLVNEDIDEIISDLSIETKLKAKVSKTLLSDETNRLKRISVRKLRAQGLNKVFIKMFIKLLEYMNEI